MPPKATDTSDSLAALQPAQPLLQEPAEPLPVHAAHDHRVGRAARHAPPVSDGDAGGEFALRPDLDVDVAAVKEGRLQKAGDHAGVAPGGAFATVFGGVEAFEEFGPGGDGLADGGT